jgi:hypothetical protein
MFAVFPEILTSGKTGKPESYGSEIPISCRAIRWFVPPQNLK